MTVNLLTEQHLEFLSLRGGDRAHLSLHLSKCHIVGNHMLRLNYLFCMYTILKLKFEFNTVLSINN